MQAGARHAAPKLCEHQHSCTALVKVQVHEKCNFRKYPTPLHCAVPLPLIFKAVFVNANIILCRPAASRGAWEGGGFSPPVFGQTVNHISTRGADYVHHSTKTPPGFSDFATALLCSYGPFGMGLLLRIRK